MIMTVTRLCERVAEVWYGHGRPGDDAVAVGVIAGLCLLVHPDYAGPEVAAAEALINTSTDDEIADLLAKAWAAFWVVRPELAFRCESFAKWLDDDPRNENTVAAAAAVARAAIKAGLWSGRYGGEDVIGTLWTGAMCSDKGRQARGEFYTPAPLTQMMAAMTLADASPGQSICDPCCGTGGIFLGAAQALRKAGIDPAEFVWVGADISPVSVAGAAVNAYIWGLGDRVVLGVADTLAEGDCHARHVREQFAVLEHHRGLVSGAKMLACIRRAEELTTQVDGDGNSIAA